MDPARLNPYRDGRRVGLIIPSVNATIEPELAWLALPSLSFHTARVMLRETTPEGLRAMNVGLEDAACLVASVAPDVVAFACTSGSFLDGPGALADQLALIGRVAGCAVVATSAVMIEALQHLGIGRIALATPYLDVINHAEQRFFEGNGIKVTAVRGLGLSGGAIREVPPDQVMALARSADAPDAEAIFISCTDLRALETVAVLERELGKPVLTSNQVTLWGILRALGHVTAVPGFGRLLA